MEYTLMHKSIPVVDLILDETGYISKLRNIHDERRLPIGVNVNKSGIDRKALNDWWTGRSIPASRAGIDEALQNIGITLPLHLIEKCYGLSLSDQYWICPKGSGLAWEDVNFFNNEFSKDMGEVLFGREPDNPDHISLMSPDNTSDGWLRKKWIIADGKCYLMKGGSGVYQQEPFNEIIASAIMRRLDITHIPYTLTFDGDNAYSLCENFITPDTELIPAWRVIQTRKQPNSRSPLDHFLDCCEALGVPDVEDALARMLTLDYIIANEDRNWNNFGLIRNADTLRCIGFAPVYDSGTSLWHDTPYVGRDTGSKPFRKSHAEQIKLVKDLSWFNHDALNGLSEEITDIFAPSDRIDEKRRTEIVKAVTELIGQIERLRLDRQHLLPDTPSVVSRIRAAQKERRDCPTTDATKKIKPKNEPEH